MPKKPGAWDRVYKKCVETFVFLYCLLQPCPTYTMSSVPLRVAVYTDMPLRKVGHGMKVQRAGFLVAVLVAAVFFFERARSVAQTVAGR